MSAPDGSVIHAWQARIGGTVVGAVADQPLQPGVTYVAASYSDVTSANAPAYADIVSQHYDPGADNAITGGSLADSLQGGAGNDTIFGGGGNDAISGGAGSDALAGGAGNDCIDGGTGDDTLAGGAGADTLSGGTGLDLADYSGSAAGVSIDLSKGAAFTGAGGDAQGDVFSGVDGVIGSAYDDTLIGFDGQDTAAGDVYSNVLSGGAGNDYISGLGGDDSLYGGSGNDRIYGGAGDDAISGGAGDDLLGGGLGNDFLAGGAGNDTITTGAGADTLVFAGGAGADTVTDFDLGDSNGDGFTNDQLDVADLLDARGQPVRSWEVTISDDRGNALLSFPGGEQVTLQGLSAAQVSQPGELFAMGVPCFVAGTAIATPGGPVPVEALRPGDLVETLDHGAQPLLWAGGHAFGPEALRTRRHLCPVRIAAGVLGNAVALSLSPQHSVVHAATGGLIRARHLAEFGAGAVRVQAGCRRVAYRHLLFARHEIVFASGAACESSLSRADDAGLARPGALGGNRRRRAATRPPRRRSRTGRGALRAARPAASRAPRGGGAGARRPPAGPERSRPGRQPGRRPLCLRHFEWQHGRQPTDSCAAARIR